MTEAPIDLDVAAEPIDQPAPPSTAAQMLDMLRRHYLPEGRQPAGIFAPELTSPDGGRRADLIWQGLAAATGGTLVGHEIKVTRADLLAELADPAKSDPWQRYCDHWWLVIPNPRMIDGLDIPDSWGVLTPPSGRRTRSMTPLVTAPRLKPISQGPAHLALARWLHWRHDALRGQHAMLEREAQHARREVHELRVQMPRNGGRSALDEFVADVVRRLGGLQAGLGMAGTWEAHVSAQEVADALLDLGSTHRRVESLLWSLQRAGQAARDVAKAIPEKELVVLEAELATMRAR